MAQSGSDGASPSRNHAKPFGGATSARTHARNDRIQRVSFMIVLRDCRRRHVDAPWTVEKESAHSMIASAHGNRNLARVRNTDSGTMEPIALNQLERFAMIDSGECMGIQSNGQQSR
jgi:hypothetical protein